MFGKLFIKALPKSRTRYTYYFFWGTLLLGAVLRYLDSFLRNASAPNGIISFELAKDTETATAMLQSWDEIAKTALGLSLGFDFIFPICYSGLLALLIIKSGHLAWNKVKLLKRTISLANWMAVVMLCDFIENIGLIQLSLGSITTFWVTLAYFSALIKFCLIFIGIGYILISFAAFFIKKVIK